MTDQAFGLRLAHTLSAFGHLCVGIDPHPFLLDQWGLDDSAEGVRDFGLGVVEASRGRVGIVKPQIAFFERHGAAGFSALELVLARARDAGLLVIADAKRGDLGSSVEAYAQAWLTPGSPLEADAMTLSAYQGASSLERPVELARSFGKGLFVLAATSNIEAAGIQTARSSDGNSVAGSIVKDVMAFNGGDSARLGSFGIVLGATVSAASYGIRLDLIAQPPAMPILAPGFGFQGARFAEIRDRYGPASEFVIASTSREVLSAGPQGIADAISRTTKELAECLA